MIYQQLPLFLKKWVMFGKSIRCRDHQEIQIYLCGSNKFNSFINNLATFRNFLYKCNYLVYPMNSPTNWEFFKQDQDKIILVHICTEDLDGIAISINNWWKRRYPDYKIRVVSKNEFEQIKNATELPQQ